LVERKGLRGRREVKLQDGCSRERNPSERLREK
jgi:hypothetical protein